MPPYMIRKPMLLAGTNYPKGAVLPQELVDQIPAGRLRSLTNTGLFVEVPEDYDPPVTSITDKEKCPVCGESFKRLAQHISMKHETPEALAEAHLDES